MPEYISKANDRPSSDNNRCTDINNLFLSILSVITPAIGPIKRKGNALIPVTAPVKKAELVYSYANHPRVTCCIQLPADVKKVLVIRYLKS